VIPVTLAELPDLRPQAGCPSVPVTGLSIDSRLVEPGSLFVALRGRVHDGHDFLGEAARAGAAAIVCSPGRARPLEGVAVLEAEPLAALAAVAGRVRAKSRATVVAIAGSAGKTSTKDILASLCAPRRATVANPESFNNEIGLPLTLARVQPNTELLILELGTGGQGELAALAAIARPHIGVITAIGPEHLEFLGSLDDVAAAEAELIAALPPGGTIVLPHREPLLEPYRRTDLREITFGLNPRADVYPILFQPRNGFVEVSLSVLGQRIDFRTNLTAPYHRLNLCAAFAACAALGLPPETTSPQAASITLSRWRGQQRPRTGGGILINDAYNANPLSMQAAIEALAACHNRSRTVAVLGEMAELGTDAPRWHATIGAIAATAGIDVLAAIGPLARSYLNTAAPAECHWFTNLEQAIEQLPQLLRGSDSVLLKASRSAGLELLEQPLL
jgi:UDP-N-acetylmuramoyl-tripeptide--D-alanyl-D-alanine ligase